MKRIRVTFPMSPATIERLDSAIRIGRREGDAIFADMDRTELVLLALELGLRQIEDRLEQRFGVEVALQERPHPSVDPASGVYRRCAPEADDPPGSQTVPAVRCRS